MKIKYPDIVDIEVNRNIVLTNHTDPTDFNVSDLRTGETYISGHTTPWEAAFRTVVPGDSWCVFEVRHDQKSMAVYDFACEGMINVFHPRVSTGYVRGKAVLEHALTRGVALVPLVQGRYDEEEQAFVWPGTYTTPRGSRKVRLFSLIQGLRVKLIGTARLERSMPLIPLINCLNITGANSS